MEIEAKFAVPNRASYRQLARLRDLAGYTLTPAGVAQVADRYFDTADGRLRTAGYTCRLRAEGEAIVATLKGLGGVEGAVHRRTEEEVRLTAWDPDPTVWPQSKARTLARDLAAGAALEPLFDLTQRRARADVSQDTRRVAQLSLDHVRTDLTSLHRPVRSIYYELEVELVADGREADLAYIAAELATTWGLIPEPRSKFERTLALLHARQAASTLSLTADERRSLETHAAGDVLYARRAAAVLGWAEGLALAEIADHSHLSVSRVRFWVRAFRERRLAIFGAPPSGDQARDAVEVSTANPLPPAAERATMPAVAPVSPANIPLPPATTLISVPRLCQVHQVDMAHARFVAEQAQLLFDVLQPIHKLPKKRRRLLHDAALLNTVGAATDPAHARRAGRDLILAQPLRDVNTAERLALASIVALGQGKARPDREPTLGALDEKLRRHTLILAGLVRIAEALDLSRTQETQLQAFENVTGDRCEIIVGGPQAAFDAAQANQQTDLWRELFKQELIFIIPEVIQPSPSAADSMESETEILREREPDGEPAAASNALLAPIEILPLAADDPMSEAGRKALSVHFNRMLANEAGTRLGADPEALHDMRVSTRRMRAALAVFAPHYIEKTLQPLLKGLRRTGRTLGAVRDLDVLLEKIRAYATELPAEAAGSLDPLIAAWESDRDRARRVMLDYLNGAAYRQFVNNLATFLLTPGAGAQPIPQDAPLPFQVRHVVPRLILTRYESVRAYERLLPGPVQTTYHALRIECKGLRYALEFFRDLLGDEVAALIKQVTGMQDLLGDLQDAYVAEGLLTDFLAQWRDRKGGEVAPGALAGVEAYLTVQRNRQTDLLAAFPAPWADLVGLEFRQRLAQIIATL